MKALVLAGGVPQIKLIKELQNRGYFVILADYYENPVAKEYADKFYQESTLDIPAIKKIAVDEQVNMIITCCTDQALETVARLSTELNLPCYVNAETGLAVTNKQYMKNIFLNNQIPTANYYAIHSADELESMNLNYPLVVKPADCNSSKGVVKVNAKQELISAVTNALNFSRTNTAIVEEYIEGKEISVDLFVCDGKAKIICHSFSEKLKDDKRFVISKGQYPAKISSVVLKKIEVAAQKIVEAFNLKNCPMLMQLLLRDDDIFILEFSARTGGCIKYHMIELASGIDVIKLTVDLFEGKKVDVCPKYRDGYVVDEFIYCRKGIFASLVGFDECVSEGVIEEYFLLKNAGEKFEKVESSGDRIIAYTIVADTYEEYMVKHNLIANKVKVLDILGNDIMRHDLFSIL